MDRPLSATKPSRPAMAKITASTAWINTLPPTTSIYRVVYLRFCSHIFSKRCMAFIPSSPKAAVNIFAL